ncbi:MAG: hypothetical protein KDB73_19440, partial [Planctomycetes bacterium]|nr:hypothetical protein [Planctomycetota bacterium]
MARPVLSGVDELVTQQALMTPTGVSDWSKIDKVVDGLVAANELPKLVTPKPGARERTITVQNADVKLRPWLGTQWIVRVYLDVRWLHEVPLDEA